jgi:hypothetical protein
MRASRHCTQRIIAIVSEEDAVYDVYRGPPGLVVSDVYPTPPEVRMAKKKTESKEMAAIAEPVVKPVRLDLSPELHQMLRVVAAEAGSPMSVYARDIVEKTVRGRYKELRGK